MMSKFFSLLFLALVSLSACKTTTTSPENTGPRKPMLKYQDLIPLPDLWESWTPVPETGVPALFSTAAPFDYWQVKEENEIELVWSVLSTVVSGLRSQTEDEKKKLAIRSTLILLEPTPIDRSISTLDVTFLTSSFTEKSHEHWEGVVIRWFKKTHDGLPTITLFMSRRSNSKNDEFDRAILWIEPGFSELPAQSFIMKLENEKWNYRVSPGLTSDLQAGKKRDAKIYVDTLVATLWKNFTNASYVKYDKMETSTAGDGFGKIKLRDIEMVFEHTQFPPRFNFKTKNF